MKIFFATMGIILAILGLCWIVQGNDFFMLKFFAPKYEQVRRETFEQSKAYNQGMQQELENMQFEYIKSDREHQKALAFIIIHRAADYPIDKLTPDMRSFINDLKNERINP